MLIIAKRQCRAFAFAFSPNFFFLLSLILISSFLFSFPFFSYKKKYLSPHAVFIYLFTHHFRRSLIDDVRDKTKSDLLQLTVQKAHEGKSLSLTGTVVAGKRVTTFSTEPFSLWNFGKRRPLGDCSFHSTN